MDIAATFVNARPLARTKDAWPAFAIYTKHLVECGVELSVGQTRLARAAFFAGAFWESRRSERVRLRGAKADLDLIKLSELRAHLKYCPATGLFSRYAKAGRYPAGSIVGSEKNGYIVVRYKGQCILAHRLAWFYIRGVWPTFLIDHKDGSRANNAFENLRDATPSENANNLAVHREARALNQALT
jgi:hypothetical protein